MLTRTNKERYHELPEIMDIYDGGAFSIDEYPEIVKNMVDGIVKFSRLKVSEEITLPAVMTALAFLVNSKRVTYESYSPKNPFLNVYTIILAPSGAGKDFPMSIITNHLFPDIIATLEKSYNDFEKEYFEDPRTKLNINNDFDLSKKELKVLIEDNPIKGFSVSVDSGTDVGFREFTRTYELWEVGVPMFRMDEFSSYVGANRPVEKKDFLNDLLSSFNRGYTSGKVTGNRKKVLKVGDTPCILFTGTSLDLVNDNKSKEELINWLYGGFARRSTIVYIDKVRKNIAKGEDEFDYSQRIRDGAKEGVDILNGVKEVLTNKFTSMTKNKTISCSSDADLILTKYETYLDLKSDKATLKQEFNGRSVKARNLAGVLSQIRSPKCSVIELEDIINAIRYNEYYGSRLEQFVKLETQTFAEKVYYFVKNFRDGATTTDIRNERFVGWNRFAYEFKSALPEIESLAQDENLEFRELTLANGGKKYILVSVKDKDETRTAPIEYDLNGFEISCSNNLNDNPWEAKGRTFERAKVSEDTLIDTIKKTAIMPNLLEGGKTAKHVVPGGVLMGIDIDDGMSLLEAKSFFEDNNIRCLIITSASHQQEYKKQTNREITDKVKAKKIKPKDKFHVFAFLNKPWNGTPEQWKAMYKNVVGDIGNVDEACSNINRMFFRSPEDAVVYRLNGHGIDWESYLEGSKPRFKRDAMIVDTSTGINKIKDFTPEQNVDYYTTKVLGMLVILEGKKVVGKNGESIPGRNGYLNNIWKAHFDIGGVSRAEIAVRYANTSYCKPSYEEHEITEMLHNKK